MWNEVSFFFNELNKLYYLKERPTNVPHIQKIYNGWLQNIIKMEESG